MWVRPLAERVHTWAGADPIRLIMAFLLLNLPFWAIAAEGVLARATFNVELLLALALAAWSRAAGFVLLLLLWIVDLVASMAGAFHFPTLPDALNALHYLPETLWRYHVSLHVAGYVLLFVLCSLGLLMIRRNNASQLAWVAFLAVGITGADVANGTSRFSLSQEMTLPLNVSAAPVTRLSLALARNGTGKKDFIPVTGSAMQQAGAWEWAAQHPDGNVMLFIVESFGLVSDPALREWFLEELWQPGLEGRYSLREAQVPFSGATTYGELRELCSTRGDFRWLTSSKGSSCLPWRLRGLGWSTVGLHGFSRTMFGRERWWPATGIGPAYFGQELMGEGGKCGGAFPGACDRDVIARAFEEARTPARFVYTLTLNSHLPLRESDAPGHRPICARLSVRGSECYLTISTARALREIGEQLARSRQSPLVIIVGDHAPAFVRESIRKRYSDHLVPAYILEPCDADVPCKGAQ